MEEIIFYLVDMTLVLTGREEHVEGREFLIRRHDIIITFAN